MWDLFTPTPDFTPYTALARTIPEETGLPGTPCADATRSMRFGDPDEAEGLQAVLWAHEHLDRAGPGALDPAAVKDAFDAFVEESERNDPR